MCRVDGPFARTLNGASPCERSCVRNLLLSRRVSPPPRRVPDLRGRVELWFGGLSPSPAPTKGRLNTVCRCPTAWMHASVWLACFRAESRHTDLRVRALQLQRLRNRGFFGGIAPFRPLSPFLKEGDCRKTSFSGLWRDTAGGSCVGDPVLCAARCRTSFNCRLATS